MSNSSSIIILPTTLLNSVLSDVNDHCKDYTYNNEEFIFHKGEENQAMLELVDEHYQKWKLKLLSRDALNELKVKVTTTLQGQFILKNIQEVCNALPYYCFCKLLIEEHRLTHQALNQHSDNDLLQQLANDIHKLRDYQHVFGVAYHPYFGKGDKPAVYGTSVAVALLDSLGTYLGHVYVWPSLPLKSKVVHLQGIRTSLDNLCKSKEVKDPEHKNCASRIILGVAEWARKYGFEFIEVKDPLFPMTTILKKLGFTLSDYGMISSVDEILEKTSLLTKLDGTTRINTAETEFANTLSIVKHDYCKPLILYYRKLALFCGLISSYLVEETVENQIFCQFLEESFVHGQCFWTRLWKTHEAIYYMKHKGE